jgi:ABC-type glycerol-3-phosphate transport system substrate-binding protein
MSRRRFLQAAFLSAAGTAAAACQPQTVVVEKEVTREVEKVVQQEVEKVVTATAAPEQIVTEWWTINLKKNFGEIMQGYIDGWEADHPDQTIDWVDVPGQTVARKFATALAAGDPPDLANMYEVPRFIELQAVLPLDDLIPAEDQEAFGGYWDIAKIGGKHYGIPWYGGFASPEVVSGKLFKEIGVDVNDPPATWKDVYEMGRKGQDVWEMGTYASADCWGITQWAWAEGLEFVNEDGTEATVNTPEWEEHIETIVGLHQDGLLNPDGYSCPDGRVAIDWFFQGQGAISFAGVYILNRTAVEVLEQMEADVIPTVVGSANRAPIGRQMFVISKQCTHPQEAADFGLFVVKGDNIVDFCKAVAIAPTYLPALQDPFFTEPPTEPAADLQQELIRKARMIGIEDLQKVNMLPNNRPVFYWTTLTVDVAKLMAEPALEVVEGSMSAKDYLATWEEELNLAIETALAKGAF